MALTDFWVAEYVATSVASRSFPIPRNVAAGRLLVLAVGRTGAGVVTGISAMGSNSWVLKAAGAHSSNTVTVGLAYLWTTTALTAGSNITITASAAANRWAIACGVFNDLVQADLALMQVTSVVSDAKTDMDVGPTGAVAAPRALVCTAVATTAGGYPVTHNGNAIAGQQVTSGASANRAVALLYKWEGGAAHTGSFHLASSVISASATLAMPSAPLAANELPYMTDQGEVPGVLSYWSGGVEVAVLSLEVTG